jgi:hypothetical protein
MLHARAGAAAIAAALALSPTYAASPKPIIDLSKSPAISGQAQPTPAKPAEKKIGPFDERTAEIGGGALAILILGAAALAMRSRKRRREDEEAWNYDAAEPAGHLAAVEEPMTLTRPVAAPEQQSPVAAEQPAIVAPSASAFAWDGQPRHDSTGGGDCEELDTWMERAKCGPTADNPSQSLKKRVKRAAFFEQRERDVAEGEAVPVDPDAGLPENLEEPENHSATA